MRHGTALRVAIWTLAFGLLAGMWLAAARPARASVPCWDPKRRSRLDRSVYPPGYQGTWSLSNRGLLAASDGTLYAAYGWGSLYLSIVTPGPTGQEAEVRTLVADGGFWFEGDSRFPCPVEGPDGRVHLFFLARPAGWSGAGGCALQHLTYDPATGALAGPETVDYGRWGEYKRPLGPGLAAAVAPDGTLHLAFYNAAPQRPVLTHAWRTAEGSFQREAVYTSGPQDCYGIRGEVVDMAVDAQGHLHLAAFAGQLGGDECL